MKGEKSWKMRGVSVIIWKFKGFDTSSVSSLEPRLPAASPPDPHWPPRPLPQGFTPFKGTSHDSIFQFSLFFYTCWYFCSLETPPMNWTYPPKQSCRNDIISARGPNICSLNWFFAGPKLIQKSVSRNKSCKSWFSNFSDELDHF